LQTDNPPLSAIAPITAKEIVLAFIDRINAHDVEGLAELMSDDHTFIDAHGNQVNGRKKIIEGGAHTSSDFLITSSS